MTIALSQSQFSTGSGTVSLVLGSNPASGDLIVLAIGLNGTGYPTAPTGGGVGSWTTVQNNSSGAYATIFYGFVTGTPSATVSWTKPGSVFNITSAVGDFTGVGSVDQTSLGSHGTSTSGLGPSITPSVADELFINVLAGGNGGGFTTTGLTAGWTGIGGNGGAGGCVAYLIATDSAAHGCTFSASTSRSWQTVGASFEPPGSAPAFAPSIVVPRQAVVRASYY